MTSEYSSPRTTSWAQRPQGPTTSRLARPPLRMCTRGLPTPQNHKKAARLLQSKAEARIMKALQLRERHRRAFCVLAAWRAGTTLFLVQIASWPFARRSRFTWYHQYGLQLFFRHWQMSGGIHTHTHTHCVSGCACVPCFLQAEVSPFLRDVLHLLMRRPDCCS